MKIHKITEASDYLRVSIRISNYIYNIYIYHSPLRGLHIYSIYIYNSNLTS